MNHLQLLRSPAKIPANLARYESAPSSFLDDVLMPTSKAASMGRLFDHDVVFADVAVDVVPKPEMPCQISGVHVAALGPATLVRHSSSPAGFLSDFLFNPDGSVTEEFGIYSQARKDTIHSSENTRAGSQWSFTKQDMLSQISELTVPGIRENVNDDAVYSSRSNQSGTWDDNSIVFSAPNKRAKDNNGNVLVRSYSDTEYQFNMTGNSSEYCELQSDSVPCRLRAKRGFATHPRSIAERDRRKRISRRLQKLQDVVPKGGDKQISTSDMLDLAVQHINELRDQVQRLKQNQDKCTCGRHQETTRA